MPVTQTWVTLVSGNWQVYLVRHAIDLALFHGSLERSPLKMHLAACVHLPMTFRCLTENKTNGILQLDTHPSTQKRMDLPKQRLGKNICPCFTFHFSSLRGRVKLFSSGLRSQGFWALILFWLFLVLLKDKLVERGKKRLCSAKQDFHR